jgi:uncharacterized spore protein YtfJ
MTTDVVSAAKRESDLLDAVRQVVGSAGADRVFGSPIVQEGVIVLPAAKMTGGIGGGSGQGPAESGREGSGLGGGLGLSAKALGVFVIKGGDVSWRPAVDVNRIALGGQIVGIVALLTLRAYLKSRKR